MILKHRARRGDGEERNVFVSPRLTRETDRTRINPELLRRFCGRMTTSFCKHFNSTNDPVYVCFLLCPAAERGDLVFVAPWWSNFMHHSFVYSDDQTLIKQEKGGICVAEWNDRAANQLAGFFFALLHVLQTRFLPKEGKKYGFLFCKKH